LPLLVLDEAHHLKNPSTVISSLFASPAAESEADLLRGPLGRVFDRMLFLTATPFQLGHHELTEVLRRFEGVRWPNQQTRALYHQSIDDLERHLNTAQTAALRLDRAWGRLRPGDLPREGDGTAQSAAMTSALTLADDADRKIRAAEEALRPWVIRHTRLDRDERRSVQTGRAILGDDGKRGLSVTESTVLPFLLAARAQAIVSAEDKRSRLHTRAYFADGLASSFEAYRDTRLQTSTGTVDEVDHPASDALPGRIEWYLHHIDRALPRHAAVVYSEHPKVAATVRRAVELWKEGEKVLVFCFFRATGRALRYHISRAMEAWILGEASKKLGLSGEDPDEVRQELENRSERFFDLEAPVTRVAKERIEQIFDSVSALEGNDRERAEAIALRFLRTPSFLVRYLDLGATDAVEAFSQAFDRRDRSGRSLHDKVLGFARYMATRVDAERAHILESLEDLQTGSIFSITPTSADNPGEAARGERLMPNVRLANGEVERATRRRLMAGFNTPFFPEVLVASSVMAEGVDLHLDCRHVIHHDLDWNPSVLEQRTGRIDRLGSKAELSGQPIVVYEPFLEGTQDEKQFRVVKDRERWFNVVMGERLQLDEWSTDHMAERVSLPLELSHRLTMRLEVSRRSGPRTAGSALRY
jgi:superfamily II DNA or RNA helicase